jgi:hypothetical protein
VRESKTGEVYRAEVDAERPCSALLKITWFPDRVATVDGHPAPLLHVTPGFGAVPVAAGEHAVEVRYKPGPLKPLLLAGGLFAFSLLAWVAGPVVSVGSVRSVRSDRPV